MASGHRLKQHRLFALMGPAFIAAIAYVDPGNVAANITAGARYGYLLVWVLVLSNIAAMLVQYLSAKLGIVTGRSLPTLLGERLRPRNRILFWLQAELVAAATDLAEVIGGAIALNLLFGIPLLWSGVIIGGASKYLRSSHHRDACCHHSRIPCGTFLRSPTVVGSGLGADPTLQGLRFDLGCRINAWRDGHASRDLLALVLSQ